MTTKPGPSKRAFETGPARTDPPEAYSVADRQVVACAYAAGVRAAERREAGHPHLAPHDMDPVPRHEPGA